MPAHAARSHRRTRRTRRTPGPIAAGFTLIEVMIAIAIVVILIGIVGVNVIGQLDRSEEGAAKIQLNSLENALDSFRIAFGRYPTEDEGVEVLWSRDALDVDDESEEDAWEAFLTDPAVNDPWGNPWQYTDQPEEDTRDYELWSYGPDGEDGTDDDVRSWNDDEDAGGLGGPPAGP